MIKRKTLTNAALAAKIFENTGTPQWAIDLAREVLEGRGCVPEEVEYTCRYWEYSGGRISRHGNAVKRAGNFIKWVEQTP